MKETSINNIAVIGAGLMGYGIGLEFARFGYQVNLYNTSQASSEIAMKRSREDLDIMIQAQLLTTEEADTAYSRLHSTTNIAEAASNADYIVESVLEVLPLKQEIFAKLDEICPPTTILATNTSGLKVTDIAAKAKHPERILATHYFHPAHCMPLVEVMGGEKTDKQVVDIACKVLRILRKKVVVINTDLPKYIGSRLQDWLFADIKNLVDQGIATPAMIDDAISYGFGRRMAYVAFFKRWDMIGIDFIHTIMNSWGQEPWKPVAEHFEKGELGMKTGKGFYDWPDDSAEQFQKQLKTELLRLMKIDMENGDI
ncbi:3-hydroxyacyl-CoA dehydrogenase family protein [Chloroflexota bacterium]